VQVVSGAKGTGSVLAAATGADNSAIAARIPERAVLMSLQMWLGELT
jgi:hypothetical protein